ncbi:carbohydrate sulfotransferase 15-like [Pomacea canaliculata]|uniref:carbohydrate sulfotransferase 15-like n=1 Tax=Pomacea canaliculata TaxID=400727 RepID=UPI000D735B45|nr:carbohydrate sulfotransferase 15-like [Pomacea canaliculata]
MHQHVRALLKEPHWITRERYKGKGDCSASTMWDNDVWFILPGNSNCSEPHIIHADYIRHLVPDTKIIVLLREPISRLYSDYMFFTSKPSKASFHHLVVNHLKLLRDCFKQYTLRHCVYNNTLQSLVRVQLGLYHVFLEDWLLRFPLSQILVMRMEDMRDNVTREMLNVYSFLGLEKPNRKTMLQIQKTPRQNEGVKSRTWVPCGITRGSYWKISIDRLTNGWQ